MCLSLCTPLRLTAGVFPKMLFLHAAGAPSRAQRLFGQVAAHSRGRSQHIPEELFATAQSKGKRLILCGERDGSQKQHCRSTMLIYDTCGPPAMTHSGLIAHC